MFPDQPWPERGAWSFALRTSDTRAVLSPLLHMLPWPRGYMMGRLGGLRPDLGLHVQGSMGETCAGFRMTLSDALPIKRWGLHALPWSLSLSDLLDQEMPGDFQLVMGSFAASTWDPWTLVPGAFCPDTSMLGVSRLGQAQQDKAPWAQRPG